MNSHHLINAQFDRAVEIVQGFPKTGPIQTGYEEKLTMYSLYKQGFVLRVLKAAPYLVDSVVRPYSYSWKRPRLSSQCVGYAGQGKMGRLGEAQGFGRVRS